MESLIKITFLFSSTTCSLYACSQNISLDERGINSHFDQINLTQPIFYSKYEYESYATDSNSKKVEGRLGNNKFYFYY